MLYPSSVFYDLWMQAGDPEDFPPASALCRVFLHPETHFMQRYRKVTICALVQSSLGEKVVVLVPSVTFSM